MNFDAKQFYLSAEGRPNRQQWWLRLIPSILVDIKRWHDRDKSGWWMPILFVPIIGAIGCSVPGRRGRTGAAGR